MQVDSYTICAFMSGLFISLLIMSSRFISAVTYYQNFFLRLNDIPLYVFATFHLSIHPSMSCLICIGLVINDVEQPFLCFLVIQIISVAHF